MILHTVKRTFTKANLIIFGTVLVLLGSTIAINHLRSAKADTLPNDQVVLVTLKVPSNLSGQLFTQAISAAQSNLAQSLSGLGAESYRSYHNLPIVALKVNAQSRAVLESSSLVEHVSSEGTFKPVMNQVISRINPGGIYGSGYDGSGQAVAILDSGVEATHPFFGGRVVSEACYSTIDPVNHYASACPGGVASSTSAGSASPAACLTAGIDALECGHGTHVAGIAAGDNGQGGIHGVAKGANIIGIDVFSIINDAATCGGPSSCSTATGSDIIAGLDRVISLSNDPSFTTPIASVNMSLGGATKYTSRATCDSDWAPVKVAIDTLKSKGIATIIASGNDGHDDGISAPGCISSAVSVGSTNDANTADAGYCLSNLAGGALDAISCFTNSKAGMLDLLAPGALVTSSLTGGTYGDEAGTSMATPVVTGAWAVLKQTKPSASVDTILNALKTTGTTVTRASSGESFPLINLTAAYDSLNTPGVTVAESSGNTDVTKGGTSDSYTLVLNKAPTAQVDIAINASNDKVTPGQSTVCFRLTAGAGCNKWNDPVTVTVSPHDATITADTSSSITHTATSSDSAYNNIAVASVNVNVHATAQSGGTGNNGGTGNTSGTQNGNTMSIQSVAGKNVSLAVSGGSAGCNPNLSSFTSVSENGLGTSSNQYDFPLGLNNFTVTGCNNGGTVHVKVSYDTTYPGAKKFYKVTPANGSLTVSDISSSVQFATETVNGKQVTTVSYDVTDGGPLDQDGQANGTIVDPSGVGVNQGAGISSLQNTGVGTVVNTLIGTSIIAVGLFVGIQSMRRSNNRKLVYMAGNSKQAGGLGNIHFNLDELFRSNKQAKPEARPRAISYGYIRRRPTTVDRSATNRRSEQTSQSDLERSRDPMIRK